MAGSAPFPRQLRNVVKETHFKFAVSTELLQTAMRQGADKGCVGNVPVLHRGHTIIPGEHLLLLPADPAVLAVMEEQPMALGHSLAGLRREQLPQVSGRKIKHKSTSSHPLACG